MSEFFYVTIVMSIDDDWDYSGILVRRKLVVNQGGGDGMGTPPEVGVAYD